MILRITDTDYRDF